MNGHDSNLFSGPIDTMGGHVPLWLHISRVPEREKFMYLGYPRL